MQASTVSKQDEGKKVIVTGHYSGDFIGIIKYGGMQLAIVTDESGNDREICYMHPVKFELRT